jgi:hypothetical protein
MPADLNIYPQIKLQRTQSNTVFSRQRNCEVTLRVMGRPDLTGGSPNSSANVRAHKNNVCSGDET